MNTTTADRIAVLQAIDKFCEMANSHPSTPVREFPTAPERSYRVVYFPDTPGAKYTRIVMADENLATGERHNSSVHAFVDNATGDLYKAASWKAPAKGVRGNIVIGLDEIAERFHWTGSYLYVR